MFFTFCGIFSVSCVVLVLGAVGSIILSVTDGGGGFGGDCSCGCGTSCGSSYVLLPLLIFTCVLTACSRRTLQFAKLLAICKLLIEPISKIAVHPNKIAARSMEGYYHFNSRQQ